MSHACTPCAAGNARPAGDDPTGADTSCAADAAPKRGGCGCHTTGERSCSGDFVAPALIVGAMLRRRRKSRPGATRP